VLFSVQDAAPGTEGSIAVAESFHAVLTPDELELVLQLLELQRSRFLKRRLRSTEGLNTGGRDSSSKRSPSTTATHAGGRSS